MLDITWLGNRYYEPSRMAYVEHAEVSDARVAVVISRETLEDGMDESRIRKYAEQQIRAAAELGKLPSEVLITNAAIISEPASSTQTVATRQTRDDATQRIVRAILDLREEKPDEDWSVDEVAERANIERGHVIRVLDERDISRYSGHHFGLTRDQLDRLTADLRRPLDDSPFSPEPPLPQPAHPQPGAAPVGPFAATAYRVLIASPGDVPQHRRTIVEAIQEWNDLHAVDRSNVLLPLRWETHATPGFGRPQGIINDQLVTKADFGIAVFWTRLGTPTGEADSGTVEEIQELLKLDKPVLLYFYAADPPSDADTNELKRLREFRQTLQSKALIGEYSSLEELRGHLRRDLTKTTTDLPKLTPAGGPVRASARRKIDEKASEVAAEAIVATIQFAESLSWLTTFIALKVDPKHTEGDDRYGEHIEKTLDARLAQIQTEVNAFRNASHQAEAYLPEDAVEELRKLWKLYSDIVRGWRRFAMCAGNSWQATDAHAGQQAVFRAQEEIGPTTDTIKKTLRKYTVGGQS